MSKTKELAAGNARELGFAPERLARIGKTMDAAVTARAIPGTVTIVARKGNVVHTHVTGKLDMERDAALSIDSLFRMYSQTKPITAAVLMTLFEDGLFLLDEPVSKWIPEFANPKVIAYPQAHERVRGGLTLAGLEAARREITIFDLLTMTSGVAANHVHHRRIGRRYAVRGKAPVLDPAIHASTIRPTTTTISCSRSRLLRCIRIRATRGNTVPTSTC